MTLPVASSVFRMTEYVADATPWSAVAGGLLPSSKHASHGTTHSSNASGSFQRMDSSTVSWETALMKQYSASPIQVLPFVLAGWPRRV